MANTLQRRVGNPRFDIEDLGNGSFAEESDAPKLEVVSVEIMYELVSFLEQVEKDYIAMKQG